jgi:carboxyl-terminal processing protease
MAIYGGLLAAAAVYVAYFWFSHLYAVPVDLYHLAWAGIRDHLYDRAALKNWPAYEHKYDSAIHNEQEAIKCFNEALETLDDPFNKLLDAAHLKKQMDAHAGFYSGVGMVMNGKKRPIVVRTLIKGSPAEQAGVKPGDQVLAVDSLDCLKIPASEIGDYTREHMGQVLHFMLRRAGKPLTIVMVPATVPVESIHSKWIDKDIAYVRVENFVHRDIVDIILNEFKKYTDARALVLDLRANPGGDVGNCLETAALMLDKGDLVTLRSRQDPGGDLIMHYKLDGESLTVLSEQDDKQVSEEPRRRRQNLWGAKPIVVLVDDSSASAAEMLAGALQDNKRAVLLGQRTYGKGVMQFVLPLPNNTGLSVTVGRYYTPSGHWLGDGKEVPQAPSKTSERGLAPDIEVMAQESVEYGASEDNQLQAAVDYLRQHGLKASESQGLN